MSLMIKEMVDSEKPRERLVNYGVESLSNEELLAIILRTGTKNISVKELSSNIISDIKDLSNFKDITISKLSKIKGMGRVKAITLIASIEFGKRIANQSFNKKNIKLNNTSLVYEMFKYKFIDSKQEEFIVIYLDTKKNIIDYETLFVGTIDKSIIHPREIYKRAYLNSASGIICVHNHPSGDVTPSISDINITKKIKEVGDILLIDLIDHIIIGNNNYYSFFEHGDL